ncbi:MAG: dTMP kinase [Chthoniobacterales bacterium]|nr:dTMP kinase [Chthoniobacterales bacterium]
MTNLQGKFLVFDGGEGCGKSTQARLLAERLDREVGVRTHLVHDPGFTRIGEQIRAILLNPEHTEMGMRCEMLLYMAARAQMMVDKILPALEQGHVVISDRFVSSTLAYQLGGDGLTAGEIRAVAEIAIKGRWPDLTILLDMPLERSSARVQPKFEIPLPFPEKFKPKRAKDRIEQRPPAYHERVRQNYLDQAKVDPARHRVVSADRTIEQIHNDIWTIVMQLK